MSLEILEGVEEEENFMDAERPDWTNQPNPCLVPSCVNQGEFSGFRSFQRHWNNKHWPVVKLLRCQACLYSSAREDKVCSHRISTSTTLQVEVIPYSHYQDSADMLPYKINHRTRLALKRKAMEPVGDLLVLGGDICRDQEAREDGIIVFRSKKDWHYLDVFFLVFILYFDLDLFFQCSVIRHCYLRNLVNISNFIFITISVFTIFLFESTFPIICLWTSLFCWCSIINIWMVYFSEVGFLPVCHTIPFTLISFQLASDQCWEHWIWGSEVRAIYLFFFWIPNNCISFSRESLEGFENTQHFQFRWLFNFLQIFQISEYFENLSQVLWWIHPN